MTDTVPDTRKIMSHACGVLHGYGQPVNQLQCSVINAMLREMKLPALQETLIPSLSWEDPLEKRVLESTTHSSVLAWRIPWTEEPGRLQSMGSQRVRHN